MNNKNSLILILLCSFVLLDSFFVGLIIPILPELLLNFHFYLGGNNDSSNILYSITLSLFSLSTFIGLPLIGYISDLFGRRVALLICIFGMSISFLLLYLSIQYISFLLFISGTTLYGLCYSVYVVGITIISDISKTIYQKMSNLRWAYIAALVGFVGAQISIQINDLATMVFLKKCLPIFVIVLLILSVLLYLIFPETQKKQRKIVTSFFKEQLLGLNSILKVKNSTLSYITFQFSSSLFIQSIPLFLAKIYDYTPKQITHYFLVMGVFIVLGLIVLLQKIKKIMSIKQQVKYSLIFLSLCFLYQFFLLNEQTYWITSLFFWLVICVPSIGFLSLLTSSIDDELQGTAIGSISLLGALIWGVSAFLGGLIIGTSYFLLPIISAVFMLVSARFLSNEKMGVLIE